MKRWHMITLLLVLLVLPVQAQERSIFWHTTGWQSSTPEQQGMDSQALLRLLDSTVNAHTIIVIRNGSVVLDVSRYPYNSRTSYMLFEVAESFLSTLVGIAIDEGYIESVHQSIWDFFPADQTANMDERKQALTIEHLLTHTSGIDFYEGFGVTYEEDWVQHWLDKPMSGTPGTQYEYVGANSYLTSALLGIATGRNAAEYAQQVLFTPLGINDAIWVTDNQGITIGNYYLFMSAASMAKLGYLFLREGIWDGQQIVSQEWINTATRHSVIITDTRYTWGGYGYFWYSDELVPGERASGFAACGYRGQVIRVMPEYDLVVVITDDFAYQQQAIINTIVDAIISDQPLPDNPDAYHVLYSGAEMLENSPVRGVSHSLEAR